MQSCRPGLAQVHDEPLDKGNNLYRYLTSNVQVGSSRKGKPARLRCLKIWVSVCVSRQSQHHLVVWGWLDLLPSKKIPGVAWGLGWESQ